MIRNALLWFFCKINSPIYSPSLSYFEGGGKTVCAHCKKVHGA